MEMGMQTKFVIPVLAGILILGMLGLTPIDSFAEEVCIDDFNDNITNELLWSVAQIGSVPPTAEEINGKLEITFPSNAAGAFYQGGYSSALTLSGDFDIRTDYELSVWPDDSGIRMGISLENVAAAVGRVGSASNEFGAQEIYLVHVPPQLKSTITSDLSGKLRIERVGTIMTGYYMNGNTWISLGSLPISSDPVGFRISAWSDDRYFANKLGKILFDNVEIRGAGLCPTSNLPPVANAGPDQTVYLGDLVKRGEFVQLDGSQTKDPDGNPLSFIWIVNNPPSGSTFSFTTPYNTDKPKFTADKEGVYEIQLFAYEDSDNDGKKDENGYTSNDIVKITLTNKAPKAVLTPASVTTEIGSTITLDGTQSEDENKDTLYYQWGLSKGVKPAEFYGGPNDGIATFKAKSDGEHTVFLTVRDELDRLSDKVSSTIQVGPKPPEEPKPQSYWLKTLAKSIPRWILSWDCARAPSQSFPRPLCGCTEVATTHPEPLL